MFPVDWRAHALAMAERPMDVVVIGGGITGCGIALDAAQRGLTTLLVEKGDIASGTSSRSSKLIHGGLRYLKQMQFRITRMACRERDRMLALAPHLVQPVECLYPAYHGDRTPGWQVDLGLWMYDRLTGRPEPHRQLTEDEIHDHAPGLTIRDLDRALSYGDAMADDARLTLAVAATAHAFGAGVLTWAEVEEAHRDASGRVDGLLARDLESGAVVSIRASVVVNACGVWTDAVRARLGLQGAHLKPSRGAHLILENSALPLAGAVTFPSPDDGRPVFVVPHPEGVLLGTTDRYHDGDLDDPRPSRAETDYLLRAARAAFPDHDLGDDRILGANAGLRPILDTHADDPSEASREEAIWEERGVVSVAGGKLTTWRATAEDAVDEVLRHLPRTTVRRAAPCATDGTPLAGVAPRDLATRIQHVTRIETPVATGAARRLGNLAWHLPDLARSRRELQPMEPFADLCRAEVRAHLRWGAVVHLEDLLLRRIRTGLWHPSNSLEFAAAVRPLAQQELGWDRRRWQAEEERSAAAHHAFTTAGIVDG
jgi:glycerol-3-phosphate dehydrogenase